MNILPCDVEYVAKILYAAAISLSNIIQDLKG